MKKFILSTLISFAIAGLASAQSPKGAEQLRSTKAEKAPSAVDGKFQVLSSHIKGLGTIGKTGRYEIVSVKVRGIDSPNVTALLAYDSETDSLVTITSGVEPGLAVAIVNGGASVGSSFLFGSKLRPDRNNNSTSVNNDSSSKSNSEGSTAVSTSDSDSSSASIASVKNENSNSQTQGQTQGQVQGQSSVNNNANVNANVNVNAIKNHNKAPKQPKTPKKTKKTKKDHDHKN